MKRKMFDELKAGFAALKEEREGKIMLRTHINENIADILAIPEAEDGDLVILKIKDLAEPANFDESDKA